MCTFNRLPLTTIFFCEIIHDIFYNNILYVGVRIRLLALLMNMGFSMVTNISLIQEGISIALLCRRLSSEQLVQCREGKVFRVSKSIILDGTRAATYSHCKTVRRMNTLGIVL